MYDEAVEFGRLDPILGLFDWQGNFFGEYSLTNEEIGIIKILQRKISYQQSFFRNNYTFFKNATCWAEACRTEF